MALCPKQIEVEVGVIDTEAIGVTLTIAVAETVHAPMPDKTEYVVVVVGLTVTVPTAEGLVPLEAVQTKGPAPLAVNTIL